MGYQGMFYLSEEGMLSLSFIYNVNSLSSVPPSYLKMYIPFHNLRCNWIIKTKITFKPTLFSSLAYNQKILQISKI